MNTTASPPTTPDAPALLSPAAGAFVDGSAPLFAWTEIPGATSYRLQVAADAAFTRLFADVTVTQTALTLLGFLPEDGATCHGRVQALGRTAGPWSVPVPFIASEDERAAAQPTPAPRTSEKPIAPFAVPEAAETLPPYLYSTTDTRVLFGATAVMVMGVLLMALVLLFGMPRM